MVPVTTNQKYIETPKISAKQTAQIHIVVPSGQALEIAVRQLLMPQCTMEFIQNPQGFPSDFGEREVTRSLQL